MPRLSIFEPATNKLFHDRSSRIRTFYTGCFIRTSGHYNLAARLLQSRTSFGTTLGFGPRPHTGTSLCTSVLNLGELAKVIEYAELEMFWRNDLNRPQFDPSNPSPDFSPQLCKLCRYHYGPQRPTVRKAIEQILASVKKNVPLIPCFRSSDEEYDRTVIEWCPSAGDFGDAVTVAQSKHMLRAPYVLSDDIDMATFSGITLYTANNRIISDASQSGMLRS